MNESRPVFCCLNWTKVSSQHYLSITLDENSLACYFGKLLVRPEWSNYELDYHPKVEKEYTFDFILMLSMVGLYFLTKNEQNP